LHGKLQHTVNGETTHFDDWEGLLDLLKAMIARSSGWQIDQSSGNIGDE
jgi:hypothetical protein